VEIDSLFSLLLPGSDRNRDDRMLGYDGAHLLARMLLDRGQMPVLECTYSRRQQRASLLQVFADTPETPLWVVEVAVPPTTPSSGSNGGTRPLTSTSGSCTNEH